MLYMLPDNVAFGEILIDLRKNRLSAATHVNQQG